MKKYNVTIQLIVNPSRDSELETPELKTVEYTVEAENENDARRIAKDMDTSSLSVWESYAEEIID